MNWWNLLRIGECTLKNIVGNFWIMQFLGETLDNAIFRGDSVEFCFNIYIYIYIYIYILDI